MSRLLRPVGPLAPRVYWLRRIVVVAAAVVVVFTASKAVGAIMPDESGTGNSANNTAGEQPLPAQTLVPGEGAGPDGGTSAGGGRGGAGDATAAGEDDSSGEASERPAGRDGAVAPDVEGSGKPEEAEAEADGDAEGAGPDAAPVSGELGPTAGARTLPVCLTDDVAIAAVLGTTEVEAGAGVKLTAELVNETDRPCRVEVNPIGLQPQVVSGSDQIWTSAHCPVLIPTGPLTLEPDEPRPLSVDWPGTRSGPECAEDQPEAESGYYEAQATLGDLVSAPEQFRVS